MQNKTSLCPVREEINTYCSCPKSECENHGLCCQCIASHKKRVDQPYEKRFPHCLRDLYQEGVNSEGKQIL